MRYVAYLAPLAGLLTFGPPNLQISSAVAETTSAATAQKPESAASKAKPGKASQAHNKEKATQAQGAGKAPAPQPPASAAAPQAPKKKKIVGYPDQQQGPAGYGEGLGDAGGGGHHH